MHSFRQDILHFLQKSRPDIFSSAPHFAFFFHFLTTLWANKKAPQTNKFVCGAFGPAELDKSELVGARPLHLACARPRCRLKAPLGLSLLRKRQFLHSILFFKRKLQHGLLCGLRRGIRCDWYRIACKENKNGTCSLTTCTPRFLFYIEKERFIPRSPQAPDTALRPRRRGI